MSQETRILAHLKAGHSLTQLEALNKFGSLRLGARVYQLKAKGYPIRSNLVRLNGKRVARYRLAH